MKKILAVFIIVSMVMALLAGGFTSIPSARADTTYTVTFDGQGGDWGVSSAGNKFLHYAPTTGIAAGATITLPEAPAKAGFSFAGWNTAPDGTGTTFTATTPVTADITIYASYTAIPAPTPIPTPAPTPIPTPAPVTYTVSFDGQGGDWGVSSAGNKFLHYAPTTGIAAGATITLPEAPAKAGFSFAGWNTAPDGTGTTFTATTPVTADITIYASYTTLDETMLEAMYPAKTYYHETLWIGQVLMKTIEPSPRDYIDVQAVPVIIASRTYLPMRFVVENLMPSTMAKTAVTWDAKARKATFVRGSHKVEVWIGKSAILVNGVSVVLDAPAFITAGRTMMPLRAISEGLGAFVNWMATDVKGLSVNRIDIFASRTIN